MKNKLNIVIFTSNLRVADNPPLYHASQDGNLVAGIYSFEILGTNKFQNGFVYETLLELKNSLNRLGIKLLKIDSFEATLLALAKIYDIKIYFQKDGCF